MHKKFKPIVGVILFFRSIWFSRIGHGRRFFACKRNDGKHRTKILYEVLPKAGNNKAETIQKIQQAFGDLEVFGGLKSNSNKGMV